MTGACSAAMQERIRFIKINGYGSKLSPFGVSVLKRIGNKGLKSKN
jgi:hypothetical protein